MTINKIQADTDRQGSIEMRKEVASILCAGLKRILPENSSDLSSNFRDSFVDFSPLKSGIARRKLRSR